MPLSLSLLIYPLLFMFGHAFTAVLQFAVEDYFQKPVGSCFIFASSYIKCLACISVLAVVLSSCIYIWKKYFFNNDSNNDNKTAVSTVNRIFKDIVFCISAFISLYFCTRTFYCFLVGQVDVYYLLKIAIDVCGLAIFMVFIALDRKNIFRTNFKLFFGTFITVILLAVLITLLCVHKFANLGAVSRVRPDVIIFRCLETIDYETRNCTSYKYSKHDIDSKLYDRLLSTGLEQLPKGAIQYKVNDTHVDVTFNIQSGENDRDKTRAIDRIVYQYNKSEIRKYFNEYKQPGEYTKTFKIEKKK